MTMYLALRAWRSQIPFITLSKPVQITSRALSTTTPLLKEAKEKKGKKEQKEKKEKKEKKQSTRLTDQLKSSLPPKKLHSAYLRFHMERLEKDLGTKSIKDIARESGAAWKTLSDEAKAKYNPSAEEQAEYNRKLTEWATTVDKGALRKINAVRSARGKQRITLARDPNYETHVRRPASPFAYFIVDFRAKHVASDASEDEKFNGPAFFQKAQETWQTLSDVEKEPYIERRKKQAELWTASQEGKSE